MKIFSSFEVICGNVGGGSDCRGIVAVGDICAAADICRIADAAGRGSRSQTGARCRHGRSIGKSNADTPFLHYNNNI